MDRDRSQDTFDDGLPLPRGEVELARALTQPRGTGEAGRALDELMAVAQPLGWRWVQIQSVYPGDDAPAQGAEALHAAFEKVEKLAREAREEIEAFVVFEDPDEVPGLYELEDAMREVEREYHALVSALEEQQDDRIQLPD